MVAISFVRKFLHFIILIISHTITKYGQINSTFSFLFYHSFQIIIAAYAYIKITIGTKYHPVISFFYKILFRNFISEFNSCTTCS